MEDSTRADSDYIVISPTMSQNEEPLAARTNYVTRDELDLLGGKIKALELKNTCLEHEKEGLKAELKVLEARVLQAQKDYVSKGEFDLLMNKLKTVEMKNSDLEREKEGLKNEMIREGTKIDILEEKQREAEEKERTKQECSFCYRLKSSIALSTKDPEWKTLSNCIIEYNTSPHFEASTGNFTAPVRGDFFLSLTIRQKGTGLLEAALFISSDDGDEGQVRVFMGSTTDFSKMETKGVVLSLNSGDVVFAAVRRGTGWADMDWAVLEGFLITETDASLVKGDQE